MANQTLLSIRGNDHYSTIVNVDGYRAKQVMKLSVTGIIWLTKAYRSAKPIMHYVSRCWVAAFFVCVPNSRVYNRTLRKLRLDWKCNKLDMIEPSLSEC